MPYYYLLDNRLEGPVRSAELSRLARHGVIEEETPVWNPSQEHWIPASAVIMSDTDPDLMQFDDTAILTSQAFAAQFDAADLPPPRQLFALRVARECDYLTATQCDGCTEELFRGQGIEGSGVTDVLEALRQRGLISVDQAADIEMRMAEDFVPDRIGGYEILEELGRGGMGITYRARQTAMDRIVALKVLLPKWSEDLDYISRFQREARMAARLNHEYLATAYEVGEDNGRHFLSMEFVEGRTLDEIVEESGPITEPEAIGLIRQVCEALDHAHAHEVVHRDVSPKNIIVKADGRIKVIDMGLAKSLGVGGKESTLTSEGMIIGTPAYMSPERACGEDAVDIRSDIYSLGCVFYEMLTGEPPLVGETKYETITLHINNPVPPVKDLRPGVSDVAAHVIRRMTAMRPEDRYQTPAEVLEGLAEDPEEARRALEDAEETPPVSEQLAGWAGDGAVEVRLTVGEREYLHAIAQKLDGVLEARDADPEFRGYAQTLLTELVSNAFDHGCRNVSSGLVRVHMEMNEAFFRIEVIDPGPGFAAQEVLDRIKHEPLDRERQRGLFQIIGIADLLEYSRRGNHVKAVLYRKSAGSGVFTHEAKGITYVEIKGKGDLALAEAFRRWVETYALPKPLRICLMVRTDWVSSMFVGTIGKLQSKAEESGSALSVWVEHRSCYRIMQQLGVTSFVHIYDSLESAELALRYKTLREPDAPAAALDAGAAAVGDASSTTDEALPESAPVRRTPPPRRRSASTRRNHRQRPPARRTKATEDAGGLIGRIRGLFKRSDEDGPVPVDEAADPADVSDETERIDEDDPIHPSADA